MVAGERDRSTRWASRRTAIRAIWLRQLSCRGRQRKRAFLARRVWKTGVAWGWRLADRCRRLYPPNDCESRFLSDRRVSGNHADVSRTTERGTDPGLDCLHREI